MLVKPVVLLKTTLVVKAVSNDIKNTNFIITSEAVDIPICKSNKMIRSQECIGVRILNCNKNNIWLINDIYFLSDIFVYKNENDLQISCLKLFYHQKSSLNGTRNYIMYTIFMLLLIRKLQIINFKECGRMCQKHSSIISFPGKYYLDLSILKCYLEKIENVG